MLEEIIDTKAQTLHAQGASPSTVSHGSNLESTAFSYSHSCPVNHGASMNPNRRFVGRCQEWRPILKVVMEESPDATWTLEVETQTVLRYAA